jgi:adenylate kinase family enzyme
MLRIAIIGNSGSGKSTLARQLCAGHSWASLDLDTVAFEPGKIAVVRDRAAARMDVANFCDSNGCFVVEGCYADLVEEALRGSALLLFVNPGVEACLANCRERPWEPHKYRTKSAQDEKLDFLLEWVRDYYLRDGDQSLMAHQALFARYRGAKHEFKQRVSPEEIAAITATHAHVRR